MNQDKESYQFPYIYDKLFTPAASSGKQKSFWRRQQQLQTRNLS